MDDLLVRLSARAADPDRRTDVRPTQFWAQTQSLDFGGLIRALGQAQSDLARALEASGEGRVDPESRQKADEIATAMSTPVTSELAPPVDRATLDAAEDALGFALPPAIRRIYGEVADGGFGPGYGLLPVAEVIARYRNLCSGGELPRRRSWPVGLLPLVSRDPGWDCVEARSGRVLGWDPEELSERSGEARFLRSFHEIAPSVEDWLEAWVTAPTFEETMAERLASSQIQAARDAREAIAKLTPEARAQMGLPEEGWERVVWGGLGLEEEEDAEA